MKRSVLVYRAEYEAQGVFGGARSGDEITPPDQRKPIDSFTINVESPDKAREVARELVRERFGEDPESMSILSNGSISVTLRDRAPGFRR